MILGLCTACALWPLGPRGPFGAAAYLVGMLYNEMPVLAVCLALATTLTTDELVTPLGLLALGLFIVVVIGQGMILGRALRSRRIPERAMTEALGPDWRSQIDPQFAAGLKSSVPWTKVLFAPFFRRRRGVERLKHLPYGDGGRRHRLDVYRHRTPSSGHPVLVHFHGGGFVSGAKNRESLALLHRMASRGWLCVSANYRLQPQADFPDYVIDMKRVLAWVRQHGPQHGADPTTVEALTAWVRSRHSMPV